MNNKIKNKKKLKENKNLRSKFLSLLTTHYSLPTNSGFSLIELIVVIGIMIVITSIVLVNHSRFSSGFTLENLAYDVALTVRQAQFYGLSVKETGTGTFETGYGVYFDMSSPKSFIFFADLDQDHVYDTGELLDTYTITQGNEIKYLCVGSGCNNPQNSTLDKLTISFVRPNPDAYINTNYTRGMVLVGSPKLGSVYKKITVTSTGQISVGTIK